MRNHFSRHLLFCSCVGAALGPAVAAQVPSNLRPLETTFQSPPDDARVMMRWWWFGAAVTKPELARELDEMKAGGFGGFEIQPVYPLELDDPATGFRNLPYLSDEFLDDVRFVNNQAHRLGLRASLTLSSGWPYGGPYTPITEAAGQLHMIRTPAPRGARSVAVPHLSNGESLIGALVVNAGWDKEHAEQKPERLPLPGSSDLRISLPAGDADRTVLWFVSSRTGQQVKRAAVDADGFVLDHFSRKAVEDHLHDVADKLITAFGNQPPYSVFSDSLEVYGADWTPGLLDQFRRRRGYDLLPYLPGLFTSAPSEEALEVRHDWGETLTELIDENYLKPINAWATTHHTLFRSQTYGEPAVSLASNALVDLPEGEGPQWRQFSYTRWATSASHVFGRPITSAETWTWLHSPAFAATPLDMKAEADRFFLQGINQLMGHGWPYSPISAGEPGWRFYAAGAFNTHNPWWIVMPDVTRYLQRVSWILRQGEPANQVAVFLPEDDALAAFTPGKVSLTALMPRWITPALTQAIEDAGYNFDYIDSAAIEARGIHYPVLLLPNVDRVSLATLERIAEYQRHGGKVIAVGSLPAHAPGLREGPQGSTQVAAAAAALFKAAGGAGQLIADVSQLGIRLQHTLAPDMQLSAPAPAVGFIHRRLPAADIYFVANTSNVAVETSARFGSRRFGEWLNADTGEAREMAMSGGEVKLDLAPYESRIVLLHDSGGATTVGEDAAGSADVLVDLSKGWRVLFAGGGEEAVQELTSWTENPETLYYSGIATYRKSLDLPPSYPRGGRLILTFGVAKPVPEDGGSANHPGMRALLDAPIRDAAVIYINGERAGSVWHAPYELDITSLLRPGNNELEVRVANTAINLLSGEALPDYELLWARYGRRFAPQDMDHLRPLPSGLLGKVELIRRSGP
jgi:hypothetical protein